MFFYFYSLLNRRVGHWPRSKDDLGLTHEERLETAWNVCWESRFKLVLNRAVLTGTHHLRWGGERRSVHSDKLWSRANYGETFQYWLTGHNINLSSSIYELNLFVWCVIGQARSLGLAVWLMLPHFGPSSSVCVGLVVFTWKINAHICYKPLNVSLKNKTINFNKCCIV